MSPTTPVIRSLLAVIVLGAWSADAQAVSPDGEVKISRAGLDFIAAEVPGQLPSKWTFADTSYLLMSCPGDDSYVRAKDVEASPIVDSLTVEPSTAKITVRAQVRATGDGLLQVDKALCLGSFGCGVDVELKKGTIVAHFTPRIVGGEIALQNPSVEIQVAETDVVVNVTGCGGAGSALTSAVNWARGYWVGKVSDKLETMALESIPPLIEDSLRGFTRIGGVATPLSFDVEVDRVSSSSAGLGIGVEIGVATTRKASCQLPAAPSVPDTSAGPSFSFGSTGSSADHFGLALSLALVERTVTAYWKAGELCFSDARLQALGLDRSLLQAGGILLGMQSITSLDARAARPPQVTMVQGTEPRIEILLPGFEAVVEGSGPNGPVTLEAVADVRSRVTLKVDPISRAVTVDELATTLSKITIGASDSQGLNLSETLFKGILTDVVVPFVEGQLDGMKLLPHVMNQQGGPLAPYYVYLTRGRASASHLYVYGRVFKRPSSDGGRPSTSFETDPPRLLKAGRRRLVARGNDSLIPAELLRFRWRVNGGSWGAPTYDRGKHLDLADGSHSIEVKAVDLHGNQDASPAKLQLEVDGVAPTIDVTPAPASLEAPSLRIDFRADDDRTPSSELKVMMVLARDGATVREDPFIKGVASLDLLGLTHGSYKVTLVAEDEVGNRSQPASTRFTVTLPETEQPQGSPPAGQTVWQPQEPIPPASVNGGCALGGATAAPSPWWVLLLGLLLGGRRRQR